ncbi:SAF domain-containing protein [Cohnella lubricantis]|uniref:SAF domain-containing protein n=1 Tax=Cohnella lubricantis TaxID=2163172 RepID=A0A841THM3_9BACL|nr:SAF domain-containing protein [Cohnella lubricantis]MBB6677961.1 SAF domain-containing protein [Cohnella lubricantis]MBP2119971.1 hypothetical protein [Cohnella lubricantis]
MNRKRQMVISLSAALLSGLLVYGVYLLQLRHIRLEETEEIVVPRQFVPAGTILDKGMLTVASIPRGSLDQDMIRRVEDAEGMQTFAPLGGGEPLLGWKISRFPLLPREGEATFQIPREYVKSVSNGLRAGDWASVFVSSELGPSRRLYPEPVVVAAVKTAANMELENPDRSGLQSLVEGDEEQLYASRRDANGSIDSVNLNLTEAQWLALDSACKDGSAKLIIAFEASAFSPNGKEAGQ